jgi:hypothetical protein
MVTIRSYKNENPRPETIGACLRQAVLLAGLQSKTLQYGSEADPKGEDPRGMSEGLCHWG